MIGGKLLIFIYMVFWTDYAVIFYITFECLAQLIQYHSLIRSLLVYPSLIRSIHG